MAVVRSVSTASTLTHTHTHAHTKTACFLAAASVKPGIRDALSFQLNKHAAMCAGLNMEQLRFPSFELQYKNDLRMSASDMVLAVTAILSKPRGEDRDTAQDIFQ